MILKLLLPGKEKIQGILIKTWSWNETEDVTVKSFVETKKVQGPVY